MPNTLQKIKKLSQYIPATPSDPGFPGQPALPARVTYEWKDVRVTASSNTMSNYWTYVDEETGKVITVGSVTQIPDRYRPTGKSYWITPLDELRSMVGNPKLSADAAHYSATWGLVTIEGATYRMPLEWTSAWIMRRENVRMEYPAQPAIPARPPVAGTPARSVYNFHLGWNAGANSLRVLPANWVGTASFIIGKPVGAVVGFTPVSRLPTERRSSFSDIAFGLVFGDGLIKLRESGVTTEVLGPMVSVNLVVAYIYAGHIEWLVNDVRVHRGRFAMSESYVLDAVLYSGEDSVDSPKLEDGVPSEDGEGHLMLSPLEVTGQVYEPLSLRLGLRPLEVFAATAPLAQGRLRLKPLRAAGDPVPHGALAFAPVRVNGSDAFNDALAQLRLAGMQGEVDIESGEGAWIPQYSLGTAVMAPPAVFAGVMSGQGHRYEISMAPLMTVASQDSHAEGRLALEPAQLIADMEGLTHLVRALNVLGADAQLKASGYVTVVIAERIGAAGELALGAVGVTVDVHELIGSQAETDLSGAMVASVLEHLGAVERYRALVFRVVDGKPVLVDPGNAWVVNTDNGATTRYEGFSFNSFMAVQGYSFGVRADGVYAMGGATDEGLPIGWGVGFGKNDFGSQAVKRLDSVYAGVSATGELFVRIGDAHSTYTYRARRVDQAQRVQRFDPGRGLAAHYFTFELVGEGSAELDNISFGVLSSQRRTGGRI